MYPYFLNPVYSQSLPVGDRLVEIPKCVIKYQYFEGPRRRDYLGGKKVVAVDGEPVFAEVAIMNQFINDGWQSRWQLTYGRAKSAPLYLAGWDEEAGANQPEAPIEEGAIAGLLRAIAKANGNSYTGCWDTVNWRDDDIVFAQSKRNNKDKITPAHIKWMQAAFSLGLTEDNFLIVQWDYHPRSA